MQGYSYIKLSHSACVHFVRNAEIDGSEKEIQEAFDELRQQGIRCVYIDVCTLDAARTMLANQIAGALRLENAPYETKHWICLLDDLITLAHREPGLIIVLDNAWMLIDKRRDELFDLVEAFLSQFHHWLEQSKPCHLCLQMESNVNVARFALRD